MMAEYAEAKLAKQAGKQSEAERDDGNCGRSRQKRAESWKVERIVVSQVE